MNHSHYGDDTLISIIGEIGKYQVVELPPQELRLLYHAKFFHMLYMAENYAADYYSNQDVAVVEIEQIHAEIKHRLKKKN